MDRAFSSRQLLHLDASARIASSDSRQLTQRFVRSWQQSNPGSAIIYRDLGRDPIPHVDDLWVAAYEAEPADRTPEMRQAIQLSDRKSVV